MPGGDRSGPWGLGTMTGRAAGYCAGYSVPGCMNPIPGRGWGRGYFGRGRGWRNWYWATGLPGWARAGYGYPAFGSRVYPYSYAPAPEEEAEALRQQAELLKQTLEDIQNRISALEKAEAQKEA